MSAMEEGCGARASRDLEVGHARHVAVLAHDLADDARGREAGEAREVDGALGLAGAHEDAPLRARAERAPASRGPLACSRATPRGADRVRGRRR